MVNTISTVSDYCTPTSSTIALSSGHSAENSIFRSDFSSLKKRGVSSVRRQRSRVLFPLMTTHTMLLAKLLITIMIPFSCSSFQGLMPTCHISQRVAVPHLVAHLLLSLRNQEDGDQSETNGRIARRAQEIEVEQERGRLEELNQQDFLKRKPRKLPYEVARKWIQANLGANTKEEFLDLVENGNLRTPYIPKRPEEYYTETREWISWDHFLTGIFDDEQPSNIRPLTGVFD